MNPFTESNKSSDLYNQIPDHCCRRRKSFIGHIQTKTKHKIGGKENLNEEKRDLKNSIVLQVHLWEQEKCTWI